MRYIYSLVTLLLATGAMASDFQWSFNGTGALNYDPFSGFMGSTDVDVSVDYSGSEPVSTILRLQPIAGADWFLVDRSGNQLELLVGRRDESPRSQIGSFQLPIELGPNQTNATQTLVFAVPARRYADHGSWRLELELTLTETANSTELLRDTIVIEGEISAKAQVNIAGSESSSFAGGTNFALIDFGQLESGESERVFIQVRGNSNTRLVLSSENSGRLVHRQQSLEFIDYSVDVDGVSSSLSAPLELQRRPARNINGSAYPMTVTIGNTNGKFAGHYSDLISIDVSPE